MFSMPEVCIGDLGDILAAQASQRAAVKCSTSLAADGLGMTTPRYRAPEARGDGVSRHCLGGAQGVPGFYLRTLPF